MREISTKRRQGFTLIEVLVVVALLGIMSLAIYPSINNTLETRNLENSAREILTSLQTAKFQAVKEKLFHRVRFFMQDNLWMYTVERRIDAATWERVPGLVFKTVPAQFNFTLNFPSDMLTFSPMGVVVDFDPTMNSITLQSPKLYRKNKPDLRIVSVFAGGSVRYEEAETGG
jgi:type II secretion system protein H